MTQRFEGVIGRDWRDSTPWWPPEPEPPAGAPNVLLIVLDDVGYAQLGCYGSDIATPTIDGLAADGVRLANFHTTALCSPTRACLLTGRNHHRNGMGRVADLAMGYPGYWGMIPRENGFLSEILRAHGYASYAVGKWHLTPDDEMNMAASRASWPLGRGFDRWYGFHGGETHQFAPALYHDNHAVLAPGTYEDGYHLSADLADRAIEFLSDLRAVDEEQPFFCYLATGACHSPHHAPPEWIARYQGHFDGGWDAWRDATFARQLESGLLPAGTAALAPPALGARVGRRSAPEDQAVAARFMECFAAYLSYTDAQIGRVLDYLARDRRPRQHAHRALLRQRRELRGRRARLAQRRALLQRRGHAVAASCASASTSSAARPRTTTTRGAGRWPATRRSSAGSARCTRAASPTRASCASPARARADSAGGIRHQFAHAIDVLPTVLELAGIAGAGRRRHPLRSRRSTGRAFSTRWPIPTAPGRHETQYFEMLGSRAIYHDGWKAVTFHALGNMYDDGLDADAPFDDDVWELYHVAEDLSETNDLAAAEPERLAAMIELWWTEARRNDVLPLDNRPLNAILNPRPRRRGSRNRYVYRANGAPVPEPSAVHMPNRAHTITADVEIAGRRRRAKACCSRWDPRSAASRSTCSTAACATCTTSTRRNGT